METKCNTEKKILSENQPMADLVDGLMMSNGRQETSTLSTSTEIRVGNTGSTGSTGHNMTVEAGGSFSSHNEMETLWRTATARAHSDADADAEKNNVNAEEEIDIDKDQETETEALLPASAGNGAGAASAGNVNLNHVHPEFKLAELVMTLIAEVKSLEDQVRLLQGQDKDKDKKLKEAPEDEEQEQEHKPLHTCIRLGHDHHDLDLGELMGMGDDDDGAHDPTMDQSGLTNATMRDPHSFEKTLSEDSFSFLLASKVCSIPFGIGMVVLTTQMVVYFLVVVGIASAYGRSDNYFGIPANVGNVVKVAQFMALLITVVTQDDLIKGLDTIRELQSRSFRAAFPNASLCKTSLSIAAMLIEGGVGLAVSFLLIVVSREVFDLLLNFTAVAFVSELDEVAFALAKHGFLGHECEAKAIEITETPYFIRQKVLRCQKMFMLVVIFAGMVSGWIVLVQNQNDGQYLCNTIYVQFDDDVMPALGTFSGLYDLAPPTTGFLGDKHMQYIDRQSGRVRFGYCGDAWAVYVWEEGNNVDPCTNVLASSSKTENYDLMQTASEDWYGHDEFSREVLLNHFVMRCHDCGPGAGDHCSGRGSCSDAICDCETGWYGPQCEFPYPCSTLSVDLRTAGFFSTRQWSTSFTWLEDQDGKGVDSYYRPVYVNEYEANRFDIILFTGRRWAVTYSDLLFEFNSEFRDKANSTKLALARYFTEHWHAHWSDFSVVFLSEAMDVGTASDSNSPIGMTLFAASGKQEGSNPTEIQAPDNVVADVQLLCSVCNNITNQCLYDGQCDAGGACHCSRGSSGMLCEIPPVADGFCDPFFNTPAFGYDGGDCCPATCSSTEKFMCGMEETGFGAKGFSFCHIPGDEWTQYPVFKVPVGSTFALAENGHFIAVAEPNLQQLVVFDNDGKDWKQRGNPVEWAGNLLGEEIEVATLEATMISNALKPPSYLLAASSHRYTMLDLFICGVAGCAPGPRMNFTGDFALSASGNVLALGEPDPGMMPIENVYYTQKVHVYTLETNVLASTIQPKLREVVTVEHPEGPTDGYCWNIRDIVISRDGGTLAVQTYRWCSGSWTVQIYDWNGSTYVERTSFLDRLFMWTFDHFGLVKAEMAISADGQVVAIDKHETDEYALIEVYSWGDEQFTLMGSLPNFTNIWDSSFGGLAKLSAAFSLSKDGRAIAIAHPSYGVSLYDWDENGKVWVPFGDPFLSNDEPLLAELSSDSTVLASSLEDGRISILSRKTRDCPNGMTVLRVSVTTDKQPDTTSWLLMNQNTGEVVHRVVSGSYTSQEATYVEEFCVETEACLSFTIFDVIGTWFGFAADGFNAPGRYDLFLDGVDVGHGGLTGRVKREYIGNCMPCPDDMAPMQIFLTEQSTANISWSLAEMDSFEVIEAGNFEDAMTYYKGGTWNVTYWFGKDTCIKRDTCLVLTVTNESPLATVGHWDLIMDGTNAAVDDKRLLFPGMPTRVFLGGEDCTPTCPSNNASLLHVLYHADLNPHEISWELVANDTGKAIQQVGMGGISNYLQPEPEYFCIEKDVCHLFSTYDDGGDGFNKPGIYYLWLDGTLQEADEFREGSARRQFIGDACLKCPAGKSLFHIMVHDRNCQPTAWMLQDSSGSIVSEETLYFDDNGERQNCDGTQRAWTDICLNLDQECYNFEFWQIPNNPVSETAADNLAMYELIGGYKTIVSQSYVNETLVSFVGNCSS